MLTELRDDLHRHQDHDPVAPGQHAVHAYAEQHRGQQQELVENHRAPTPGAVDGTQLAIGGNRYPIIAGPYSLRATTMAPIRAASSSTDTASKATMYWLKMASDTAVKRWGSSITNRVSE